MKINRYDILSCVSGIGLILFWIFAFIYGKQYPEFVNVLGAGSVFLFAGFILGALFSGVERSSKDEKDEKGIM